jgi:hypothetical protein
MRRRLSWFASAAVLLLLAAPAAATADITLGTATQPAGSDPHGCLGTHVLAQLTSDPSTSYVVPAGGGEITRWQMNTSGSTPGSTVIFGVLAPLGLNTYSIVGTDSETLPDPLPADHIASFTLATPIAVSGGETLALNSLAGPDTVCYWSGGATPMGDSVIVLDPGTTPSQLSESTLAGSISPAAFTLNLAVTLVSHEDAGVTTSSLPTSTSPGSTAVLASTVTNAGPASAPITFTDNIPAGLQVDAVAAGPGACTVTGQNVTCTINGLLPGQSAPVDIVVTASAAGRYASSPSVAPPGDITDPNSANNTASAALTVTAPSAPPTGAAPAAPVTQRCVVPPLRGVPAAVARRALRLLGCTVGRVKVVSSHVAKGAVTATSPHAGTFAVGHVVTLQVSSGPKRTPARKRA